MCERRSSTGTIRDAWCRMEVKKSCRVTPGGLLVSNTQKGVIPLGQYIFLIRYQLDELTPV